MSENTFKQSRNIRIFISSTFQDMNEERSHLVNMVFPQLREKASKRNVTLTEVDLRWGITQKESEQKKVVEICLDEINNSHPFFIGILGDRYGWTPKKEELMINKALPPRYEWLADDLDNGLSITEIEMQYGVLRNEDEVYASFYIKREEKISDERQVKLKQTVQSQNKYPVYSYLNVTELGEQVSTEFEILLDKLFPEEENISKVNQQRLDQETYIANKTRFYIADDAYLAYLDNFITKDNAQYLLVTGESGIGKSALAAYWFMQTREKTDSNVVTFFQTGSAGCSTPAELTQRLVTEIDDLYQLDYLTKEENNVKIEDVLAQQMKAIAGQRSLIIVIDGLNQMYYENSAEQQLNWLPELADNVKVIFTTTSDDETCKALQRKGYPTLMVHPLIADQKRQLILNYFDQYRKHLSAEQFNIILRGSDITDNTMVLVSMLDEMRRFGDFEALSNYAQELSSSVSYSEFFNKLLTYKEGIYNVEKHPQLVKEFLSFIALSHYGFTETELVEITEIPSLYWSYFYSANLLHLNIINGRITFAHQLIRNAVIERYFANDRTFEEDIRKRIISYCENSGNNSEFLMDECPAQYYDMGDWDNLYSEISKFGYLDRQIRKNNTHELIRYWSKLHEIDSEYYSPIALFDGIYEFKAPDPDDIQTDSYLRYAIWQIFSHSFYSFVSLWLTYLNASDAVRMANACARFVNGLPPDIRNHEQQIVYSLLNITHLSKKEYGKALEYGINGLELSIELYGEDNIQVSIALNNIAEIYLCIGEKDNDKSMFERSRDIYEKSLEISKTLLCELNDHIAVIYANLSSVYGHLGDEKRADEYAKRSREIYLMLNGEDNVDVAKEYRNYAISCHEKQKYEEAEKAALKAIAFYENTAGSRFSDLADLNHLMAMIKRDRKQYKEAEAYIDRFYQLFLKQKERYEDPIDSLNDIMQLYHHCGFYYKAFEVAGLRLRKIEEQEDTDVKLLIDAYNSIGKLNLRINKKDECIEAYQKSIELGESAQLYYDTAGAKYRLASALYEMGEIIDAMTQINEAINYYKNQNLKITADLAYMYYNRGVMRYNTDRKANPTLDDINKAIDIRHQLFGEDDKMANDYEDMADQIKQTMSQISKNKQNDQDEECETLCLTDIESDEVVTFEKLAKGDNALVDIFKKGDAAFKARRIEEAIFHLGQALKLCDTNNIDDSDIVRSPILRLLAYSKELMINNSIDIQKHTYNEVQALYQQAIDIAAENKNYALASKYAKDQAEFNWNREDFDEAEKSYWQEYEYLLGIQDVKNFLICISNAMCAISKQDIPDWEVVLAGNCVGYSYAEQSNYDDMVNCFVNGVNQALSFLAKENKQFTQDQYDTNFYSNFNIMINRIAVYGSINFAFQHLADMIQRNFEHGEFEPENIPYYIKWKITLANIYSLDKLYKPAISLIDETKEKLGEIAGNHSYENKMLDLYLANLYRKIFRYAEATEIYKQYQCDSKDRLYYADCINALGYNSEAMDILKNSSNDELDKLDEKSIILKIFNSNKNYKECLELSQTILDNPDIDFNEIVIVMAQKAHSLMKTSQRLEALDIIHNLKDELKDNEMDLHDKAVVYQVLSSLMISLGNNDEADDLLSEFDLYLEEFKPEWTIGYKQEYERLRALL